jgi:hypothetical protein
MSDSDDQPTVIAFPSPPEPEPPERIGLFAADMTLRDFLTEVIRGDYTQLDWSVAEALRLVDPGEKSPPLLRYAARNHFRKIAGEIALGREKPTMRSGASYAVVTYDRESRTIPSLPAPPPKARLQLDLIEAGVCNLCGKIHDEPGLFALVWTDPVLGLEIRAQFGGSCVAEAVFRDIHRREQSASLGNWIRSQAKRTGRKAMRNDDG